MDTGYGTSVLWGRWGVVRAVCSKMTTHSPPLMTLVGALREPDAHLPGRRNAGDGFVERGSESPRTRSLAKVTYRVIFSIVVYIYAIATATNLTHLSTP